MNFYDNLGPWLAQGLQDSRFAVLQNVLQNGYESVLSENMGGWDEAFSVGVHGLFMKAEDLV